MSPHRDRFCLFSPSHALSLGSVRFLTGAAPAEPTAAADEPTAAEAEEAEAQRRAAEQKAAEQEKQLKDVLGEIERQERMLKELQDSETAASSPSSSSPSSGMVTRPPLPQAKSPLDEDEATGNYNLNQLLVFNLKAWLKDQKLPTGGSKQELIARIREAHRQRATVKSMKTVLAPDGKSEKKE